MGAAGCVKCAKAFPKHAFGVWLAAPFRHELAGQQERVDQQSNCKYLQLRACLVQLFVEAALSGFPVGLSQFTACCVGVGAGNVLLSSRGSLFLLGVGLA
jgi:hypothetical protein